MSSRKLNRVVLKEEMVAVTGNAIKALVLNQMIYWTEILNKADQETQKEIDEYIKLGMTDKVDNLKEKLREGWFWKSSEELADELMGIASRATVNRHLNELVEQKFILKRKSPKKWDKTNHYKVDIDFVREQLKILNYALEGYAIPEDKEDKKVPESPSLPNAQNEQSNVQNEQSSDQNEQSNAHSEQTIPEITSESTTESTSKTNLNQNLSEQIFSMKLPMPLKKFFSKQVSVLVNDSFDIDILEEFYNTSPLVKSDCSIQDISWVNDFEFTKIIKKMFVEVERPIKNTHGLIKNWVLRYLSYKLEGNSDNYFDSNGDDNFWDAENRSFI